MDKKWSTKLNRRTVLKGAAAAAAAPTVFNINHTWSKDVMWDGQPFNAGGAVLRMAEWGGFLGGVGPQISAAELREGLQLQDRVGLVFPLVREIRRRRTEEPALRDRQLESQGHVPDGARRRLLPAARRRAAQHPRGRQSLGFRQGDGARHHLGLRPLHLRLPHRHDRCADQEIRRFLAAVAGRQTRHLRHHQRTADDAVRHRLRDLSARTSTISRPATRR